MQILSIFLKLQVKTKWPRFLAYPVHNILNNVSHEDCVTGIDNWQIKHNLNVYNDA